MNGLYGHKTEGKSWPQMVKEGLEPEAVFKTALEHRGVTGDPDVAQPKGDVNDSNVRIGEPSFDSDHELGDSRQELPSEELTGQIAANRPISVSQTLPNTSHIPGPAPSVLQAQHEVGEFDVLGHSNLLEDAKFYKDTVVEYQSAYYSIQDGYTQQAHVYWRRLPVALQAIESPAPQTQQELLTLKRSHNADIQQAVSNAVSQYQIQLTAAQSHTHANIS